MERVCVLHSPSASKHRYSTHLTPPNTTPSLTHPSPHPSPAGAVGGDVDKVEAIVIGSTLGALLCVVAMAMGIGIVAVFYRLKHRDSEWSHDIMCRSHDITLQVT